MEFDRNIAIAELHGSMKIARSNMRQFMHTNDIEALRHYNRHLSDLGADIARNIKRLQRPSSWQYYCDCGYSLETNESNRLDCPRCGVNLRLKTLS